VPQGEDLAAPLRIVDDERAVGLCRDGVGSSPSPSFGPSVRTSPSQVCSMNWNSPLADELRARAFGSSADSLCAVARR
jgi:hypothetical protein